MRKCGGYCSFTCLIVDSEENSMCWPFLHIFWIHSKCPTKQLKHTVLLVYSFPPHNNWCGFFRAISVKVFFFFAYTTCGLDQQATESSRSVQSSPDWSHRREENSNLHTSCLTRVWIKTVLYVPWDFSELAWVVLVCLFFFFFFLSTHTWTYTQRSLLSEGGEREKWTMNN